MRAAPRLSALPVLAALTAAAAAGCGRSNFAPDPRRTPAPDSDCTPAEGTCGTVLCDVPDAPAKHVELCSPLRYVSNPPTSGPHYPIWAAWKSYEQPVPRGMYLHSLEHSGIVLAYNCDRLDNDDALACDELVAQLESYAGSAPQDPLCTAPLRARFVVTPDPELDVPFAAAAWGYSLRARCFDEAEVDAFVVEHYGMNYENFCADGVDPFAPGSEIPPDCGRD